MSKKNGSRKQRNKPYKPYESKYGDVGHRFGGMAVLSDRQHEEKRLAEQCHLLITPFDESSLGTLARTYWISYERLKLHDATKEAWNTVAQTVNMAMLLCEQGYGAEYEALANEALAGLFRAQVRGVKTGRYRLDGPGLTSVAEILTVHDEQMKLLTPLDVHRAEAELVRRMKAGNVFQAEAVH